VIEKLKDPVWRINNLYKIVTKNSKLITFRENTHQALVNRDDSPRKMILKSRQIGFSTGCIIKMFDQTIWTPNTTSVILAHEKDSIMKLFRIVYRAYKFMNPQLRPQLDRGGGSKYEMYFPAINSRIYCDLESRSDTIQNLHISEFGLMKDDERVLATLDAVPMKGGRVIYESTPKGLNHWYDKWNHGAEKKFFFPWFRFIGYSIPSEPFELNEEEQELVANTLQRYKYQITFDQLSFRRWKISEKGGGKKGTQKFLEEYPSDPESCFLTSGDPVLDLYNIQKLISNAPQPIKDTGSVRVYKNHDKNKDYVCGADTAEGVGGDSSVGVIIEVQTRSVVAILKSSNMKPSEFAFALNELCLQYSSSSRGAPLLAVERNNHGHAVLLELNEHLSYPNLYFRKKISGEEDYSPGWVTDKITRPIMINMFVDAVENNYIKLNDTYILDECLTLINNEGKIEASAGKHDDTIIAASIGIQLLVAAGTLQIYDDLSSKILL